MNTLIKHPPAEASRPALRSVIQYRPVTDLKLDPSNPRTHSRKQIRQIAASISTFGFTVPVLLDKHCSIIAGHGRLLAAQQLGLQEVPTISLDHLSSEQAKAYMIADNRLTDISVWDDRLLAEQFKTLASVELNFSLEITGFDMGEIDLRIEGLETVAVDAEDEANEIPPAPSTPAVSRLGDVWLLGPHRLMCGSALDAEAYAALMTDKKAAMVFTDPPYNVPVAGHICGNGAIQHREFAMASGEMSSVEFTQFLTSMFERLKQNTEDGSLHFICMDWRHLKEILCAGEGVYSELKNLCVWTKDNAGMGSLYRSQHELILLYKNGDAPHRNHIQLGRFGRHRSNVWRYAGVNSFGRASDEGNLLALHPTVKPVALVADVLLDCCGRNEIALDPFMGSGTTLIAAERTGRIAYGMELDPVYVDTAIRRWQRFTHLTAVHGVSGKTFDKCAESRAFNLIDSRATDADGDTNLDLTSSNEAVAPTAFVEPSL